MKQFYLYSQTLFLTAFLCSCKAYKQDVMFKLDDNFTENDLKVEVEKIERNYVIQVDDLLILDVYTNGGERIVDPNNELQENVRNVQTKIEYSHLVKTDGTAKFPIVGQIKIDSLTLDQAELLLQEEYNEFYKDSFVKLNYQNKRVIVLGAAGGQVIPLVDEHITLVEILALAGGLEMGDKAQDIKVIRGDFGNPEVYQINLSTIDGMKKSMLKIEPGDIIYIEPWRRPWLEVTKDITPLLSLLSSTLTLVLVLQNL